MRSIKLFRFPELLLLLGLLSLVINPLVIGNNGYDIHLHDTYFVIRHGPLAGILFGMPLGFVLLISWILHLFLKRYRLMPLTWRVLHVAISVIYVVQKDLAGRTLFNPIYFRLLLIGRDVFNVTQWLFWIATAILFAKKAVRR